MIAFCSKCLSTRISNVTAKCDDKCIVSIQGNEQHGYVPAGLGVGSGDYIIFCYCMNCGRIQDQFPLAKHDIETGDGENTQP